MVKAKKTGSKKPKAEETNAEVDTPVDDSVEVDGKTEDKSDETSQENGDDASLKKTKTTKGKSSKKEDTEDSSKEEETETDQQNGEGETTKKKASAKKAAKPSKPQSEPARKSSRTPKPVAKEGTEEAYEVEKIVNFRVKGGKSQYLIHWKGYTKAEDTWETESSLNCPELLQKYQDENQTKGKSAKKRSASKTSAKSPKKAKKEDKDYEVEEIVGMRVKNGKKEFKIRWKGYKPSDDSWEPEKHLSCQDLISEYLEQHKDDVQAEEKKEEKKPTKKTPAKSKKGKKSKAK